MVTQTFDRKPTSMTSIDNILWAGGIITALSAVAAATWGGVRTFIAWGKWVKNFFDEVKAFRASVDELKTGFREHGVAVARELKALREVAESALARTGDVEHRLDTIRHDALLLRGDIERMETRLDKRLDKHLDHSGDGS